MFPNSDPVMFMVAFYGCLLAELVPVPIEVPLTRKVARSLARGRGVPFQSRHTDSSSGLILPSWQTGAALREEGLPAGQGVGGVPCCAVAGSSSASRVSLAWVSRSSTESCSVTSENVSAHVVALCP